MFWINFRKFLNYRTWKTISQNTDNSDFQRLCLEYLPLMFSRRHGDPSRPWKIFHQHPKRRRLESAWLRGEIKCDIFQKLGSLSTFIPNIYRRNDHQIPQRLYLRGLQSVQSNQRWFRLGRVEPENPWSYIGYWGDHQIIYLLKLLELQEKHYPGTLTHLFEKEIFVYANVPYKIKTYDDILKNPKDTIVFDSKLDHHIQQKRQKLGADGALMTDAKENIYKVNFWKKFWQPYWQKCPILFPKQAFWWTRNAPNGTMPTMLCGKWRFGGHALLFEKIFEIFQRNFIKRRNNKLAYFGWIATSFLQNESFARTK